ncbi:MAG: hypothetical protein V3S29_04200 [bacterium]
MVNLPHRWAVCALCWVSLLVPLAAAEGQAVRGAAEEAYRRGFALQGEMRTLEAIEAYRQALRINPFHGKANYEIGWSYWVLRDWEQVVRHWEIAGQLEAGPDELPDFLAIARERLSGKVPPLVRVPIGTWARARAPAAARPRQGRPDAGTDAEPMAEAGSEAELELELIARFQHFDPRPQHRADRFDRHVFSPKSVLFAPDGKTVYVNTLEGMATLAYDPATLKKKGVIVHRFGEGDATLFDPGTFEKFWGRLHPGERPAHPNRFEGKPVEAVFSHGGRFLWVSYYRRDFDRWGRMPSALAVVDTAANRIVRVLHTGPIPKSLAISPAGGLLAAVHWGDNTVALFDLSGAEPRGFRYVGEIVVGKKLPLDMAAEVDRDHLCGFCLRGAVFTRDGRHLLVGRMGGGGIAVLDVAARRHVGTVWGMKPTPRHLVLSRDGAALYVGSSASGYVSLYRTQALVAAARAGRKKLAPLYQTNTGRGTRTIVLDPQGRVLYAAVNGTSRVVALDARNLRKILEIPADSFPVGLAVSPDGGQLWVTSQGIKLRGGNAIGVYRIATRGGKKIHRPKPR